jgi:hypothetical protein
MTVTPQWNDWIARADPSAADLNTYIRDAVNALTGPPRLRAVANGIQSGIATTTWTTLTLGSVPEDSASGWTGGGGNYYAAQLGGWYGVTLSVCLAIPASNVARVGLLYQINGANAGPFEFDQAPAGANPWNWSCYDEVYLAAGDRVYPQVFHEYSGSLSTSMTYPSSLEIVWLGL